MALNEKWANWLISDLMHDFDLTKEQAIGFVGPLAMESKGFTDWQEDKPVVKGSRGGAGMAQWTAERRRAYEKHTKASGFDKDSYEAQYTYLRRELRGHGGHDGGIIKLLKKVKTVDEARDLTVSEFLRPGIVNPKARKAWTAQVEAAYKPTPYNPIPDVASELSVRRGKEPPTPMRKSGRVASIQLLNSLRGEDEALITGDTIPTPLPAGAGDKARAKAATRDMKSQPGFLSTLLEEAGILPPLSESVTPMTFERDVRGKKAPVQGLMKVVPGRAPESKGSTAVPQSQIERTGKAKTKAPSESMGTAINRYRRPTIADMAFEGSVPNVSQSDAEFDRSVLNGYREIQHMGPSSKGAKAKPQVTNSSRPSGATKTVGPSQEPIPAGVRPKVVVNGVDHNARVTDPVNTRSHLTRNARAATVAATSLLKAGLVDPQLADTVMNPEGVFIEGLKAPTPMDRIRGTKARENASVRAPKPLDRPSSFNETRQTTTRSAPKASKSATKSGGSTQSTPAGYTRISSTSFVDSSGGVYYDRHVNSGGGGSKRK